MTFRGRLCAAIALVLAPWLAAAGAAYIVQSGNVTYGHLSTWAASGTLQDAGTSDTGNINTLGIIANGGTPLCINTAPVGSPRLKFCLAAQTGSAATISLYAYNGAATVPLNININGNIYPFPGTPTTLGTLRTVSSGTTDTASSADGTIAWNSSSTSAKTESLYSCSSSAKGLQVTVKDEYGSAGTYNISIAPAGSDTIDAATSYYLAFNYQSATFQCNGAGNWLVN